MSQPVTAMIERVTAISQPVYSMTGFARVSGHTADGLGYTLSIKSVNHRFLDPQFRLPSGLDSLELGLRRLLKERLVRGHIDVTLQLDRAARSGIQFDRTHLAAYLAAFQQAAAEHSLTAAPDLNQAFRFPGILTAEGDSAMLDTAALEAAVLAAAGPLIEQLNTMRAHEGAALVAELLSCMAQLEEFVAIIEPLRADIQRAYFDRLRQRIEEITEAASTQLDPQRMQERILQEAAILAERSDIQEELVRLRAHIGHFRELLNAGGELGKKLDFLLQELNREANTLLSKTNGAAAGNGLRITEVGLGIKSVIEKAREQVQNLE